MKIYEYKSIYGFNFYNMKFKPSSDIFWTPHNHQDFHEIILFLNGNAEFSVEGNHYPINPYDIIFTRSSEFHNILSQGTYKYEAIVFEIYNNFFLKNECEKYKDVFLNRPLGVNNLIPAELVKKYKIDDLFEFVSLYLADEENEGQIAANSKTVELLYLLNHINVKLNESNVYHNHIFNSSSEYSQHVRDVIMYINDHLTEEMNLDKISEAFYMSKSHLCHSFKTHTGYSVSKYISLKRLTLVQNLVEQGRSWLDASVEAGFGNYSNFYKTFKNAYGCSPTKK